MLFDALGMIPQLCRSTPPRIGAVLVDEDGLITYTDVAPPPEILKQFRDRRDNQIASLEMLAIAYGEHPSQATVESHFCIKLLQACPPLPMI